MRNKICTCGIRSHADEARFCWNCGLCLEDLSPADLEAECRMCGRVFTLMDKFCVSCGAERRPRV